MIKVVCTKDLRKITITGHANFADKGQDIVCASVSSIVITTINAILSLDTEAITYQEHNGKIVIEVVKDLNTTKVLLQNMLNLLTDLAKSYKKNIKIC